MTRLYVERRRSPAVRRAGCGPVGLAVIAVLKVLAAGRLAAAHIVTGHVGHAFAALADPEVLAKILIDPRRPVGR